MDTELKKQSLISIVDDEACVRESLSSLIRSMGYKVEEFPSAESFLLEGKWDETACLILDVRLQGMGGLELQRRLAELGREHPPIVFISGHATEKEQTWAKGGGAVAFLRKPFTDEALLKSVRESVARVRAQTARVKLFSFFGGPEATAAAAYSRAETRYKE
jgi:FixJ family two-component response regulator